MPQAFKRINPTMFTLLDDELLIVAHGQTTYHFPVIIGTAFLTRHDGWRVLRLGCIDIGYAPNAQMAALRLLADHRRHDGTLMLDGVSKELPI